MDEPTSSTETKPRYTWPFYLAAALLLGLVICVVAVKREADRVRAQKELQKQFAPTEKQP
jgi:F0F1-type ATP synthase assembly protein I